MVTILVVVDAIDLAILEDPLTIVTNLIWSQRRMVHVKTGWNGLDMCCSCLRHAQAQNATQTGKARSGMGRLNGRNASILSDFMFVYYIACLPFSQCIPEILRTMDRPLVAMYISGRQLAFAFGSRRGGRNARYRGTLALGQLSKRRSMRKYVCSVRLSDRILPAAKD